MDGSGVTVANKETSFVLDGQTYTLMAYDGKYMFWVGLNGPRLFFIADMKDIDVHQAHEASAFCFGGAEKAGWEMNYEPMMDGGMSVWATCMTNRTLPVSKNISDVNGVASAAMTPEGIYYQKHGGRAGAACACQCSSAGVLHLAENRRCLFASSQGIHRSRIRTAR